MYETLWNVFVVTLIFLCVLSASVPMFCSCSDPIPVSFGAFSPGGRYQLEIKIPETYPFNPPKVGLPSLSAVCSLSCLTWFTDVKLRKGIGLDSAKSLSRAYTCKWNECYLSEGMNVMRSWPVPLLASTPLLRWDLLQKSGIPTSARWPAPSAWTSSKTSGEWISASHTFNCRPSNYCVIKQEPHIKDVDTDVSFLWASEMELRERRGVMLLTMFLFLLLLFGCRAAAMTLRTVLLSLQALLAAAEPDDPQDAVVANQVSCLATVCSNGLHASTVL